MASVAAAIAIYRLAMRYIPRHTDESLSHLGIKKRVFTQENGKPYIIFGEWTDLALTKKTFSIFDTISYSLLRSP